jgi:hypothetical protein
MELIEGRTLEKLLESGGRGERIQNWLVVELR